MVIIKDRIKESFSEGLKPKHIGLTAIGIFILVGVSAAAVEALAVDTDTQSFEANGTAIEVGEEQDSAPLGIEPGQTLTFGSIPVESSVTRTIELSSDDQVLVRTDSTGNISEHLEYPRTVYFSGPEEIQVSFNSTDPGYYEGQVDLKISSSENRVGDQWLELKDRLY